MQYAAHLPNTRSMLAPVVAFAVGAAGAVGTYAILDETDISVAPTRVIAVEQPAPNGAPVKDEAGSAAAIGSPVRFPGKNEAASAAVIGSTAIGIAGGKDEAATASAVGTDVVPRPGGGPPAESRSTDLGATVSRAEQLRSDPHGPAATLRSPQAAR